MLKQLTPILLVDAIEPALPFWTERLGCTIVAEVPHGDALGFCMVTNGDITIMYQSRASQIEDLPGLELSSGGVSSMLYIRVDDLDKTIQALGDVDIVVPPRTTFYGAREIWVREPGGHVVGFSEMSGD